MADDNYLIVDALVTYIVRSMPYLILEPQTSFQRVQYLICAMLEKTIKPFNPLKSQLYLIRHLVVWRNDIYDQYKANRDRMPDDLVQQIQPIKIS